VLDLHVKWEDLEWQHRDRFYNVKHDPQWARPQGDDVRNRNRYVNVDPYTNNRIRLLVPDGHSDYINASPIVLQSTVSGAVRNYIATQGPKDLSLSHFWRMVWQETADPAVIVMLTQTHEAGREKCFPYYPQTMEDPVLNVNVHDEFHDGVWQTVTLVSLQEGGDTRSIIRELELAIHPSGEKKKVWHMLFEGWPDFNVPEGQDRAALLGLVHSSRARNTASAPIPTRIPPAHVDIPSDEDEDSGEDDEAEDADKPKSEDEAQDTTATKEKEDAEDGDEEDDEASPEPEEPAMPRAGDNPRIVHCSAGVGRSGTFVALDWLLTELHEGALDDVPPDADPILDVVERLRTQRMMMVQAEPQFWFLYTVMREQWIHRWRERTGQPPLINMPPSHPQSREISSPPSEAPSEIASEISMQTAPEEPSSSHPEPESDEEMGDSEGVKSEDDKADHDESDTESEEHDSFRKELEAEIEQNVAAAALH
jgi:protein-tyrosine phosphatase